MLQIILFLIGIIALVKGKIKATSGREIVRPQSTYLGIIFIIFGIAISLFEFIFPYNLAMFIFPVIIAIGFAIKGKKIDKSEIIKEKQEVKKEETL